MTESPEPRINIDALPPPEMARLCADVGTAKAARDTSTLLLLGILAGAFISLGAIAMITTMTGASGLPWGLARAIGGIAFSLGLILVIVGGAELFTGDCLMVIAWAGGRIRLKPLLRAWGIVYAGNLIGAISTAVLVFAAEHYRLDGGLVGATALNIGLVKSSIASTPLFFLAVLCNVLVCLAVWMALSARSTVDKVVVIIPAVAAFVAAGFEHSIANAFFLPYALLIKTCAAPEFWTSILKTPDAFAAINAANILRNLALSTAGNLVGGSLLVGGVYWVIYLRRR